MKRCFITQLLMVLAGFLSVARAQTPVNLGTVQVSQMGHAFVTNTAPIPNWTMDYFIDQAQTSGGGAMLSQVTVDWQTNNQFVLTVSAPPGDMFLVASSFPSGKFSGSLAWDTGSGGFSPLGTVQVNLVNLQGAPPDFSQSFSFLNDSHSAFGFGMIDSAPFIKEIAFTSMVITGTAVPQSGTGGGVVFPPKTNSSLAFITATSQSSDPGPRVTIVPFVYRVQAPFEIAPTIQYSVNDAGDFVVTYVGALQSATGPTGPFSDVYGHPLNAFVVPKADRPSQLFFRTRYTP